MTLPRITIASYELANDLLGSTAGLVYDHVISINNPKEEPPRPLRAHQGRHLVMHFHDITGPGGGGMVPPSRKDVKRIIEFAEDIEEDHDVLVHCAAGISRSSAAALAVIASKLRPSPSNAQRAIKEVLDVKSIIHPNRDMVVDTDKLLGYGGPRVDLRGRQPHLDAAGARGGRAGRLRRLDTPS
jgi:predicted protein tyrosine phosphatase